MKGIPRAKKGPRLTPVLEKAAYDVGVKAHKAGKRAIPAQDKNVMDLMRKNPGNAIRLMDAWTQGWHKSNLNVPFDFEVRGRVVAVPFIKHRVEPRETPSKKKEEGIVWKSASRPRRKRFTGGGEKWITKLTGTRNGQEFNVLRTLDDARSPEPTEVVIDGKRLRWS